VKLPSVPGVSAGRRVCRSASVEQVRRRYLRKARAKASQRDQRFLKAAAEVRGSSSSWALAARVYAMSVAASRRTGAYAGCAYELSMKNIKESGR
jgi:hypothetical protein